MRLFKLLRALSHGQVFKRGQNEGLAGKERKSPLISTIVLNWNRADLLQRTLQSYIETVSVPHEIFIIDNASNDNSRDVIERFCSSTPNAEGIFLTENLGGEAINIGLEKTKGKFLHISENDIEYLTGWSERVIDLFESFQLLGQLSLFGPVPTDEEVWILKPSVLRHSKGRILYEAQGNVGTTSIIRRDLFDKGIHIKNVHDKGFLFPADGRLSQEVKNAGYMVAWADHYLVRNLGHFASEFENRADYYRENYKAKLQIGESGWKERINKWKKLPKPVRGSILFPDEQISGEKTTPSIECPDSYLWSMLDGWTAEVEVLEFLYGLVRLIKPDFAIETGTWHGFAAQVIGSAMRDNGFGMLVTMETDVESYQVAKQRIEQKKLDKYVTVLNQSSLTYNCDHVIDFLLLDSTLEIRGDEFYHFLPSLKPGATVFFHDTGTVHQIVRDVVSQLVAKGLLDCLHIPSPRGLAICRYGGPKATAN